MSSIDTLSSKDTQTGGERLRLLLAAELQALRRFHDSLLAESEALRRNDAATIEQATRGKRDAAAGYTQCRRQRTEELAAVLRRPEAGDADLAAGIDRLHPRDATPGADSLRQLYGELVSLAQTCQALNAANGRLIHRLQDRTRDALAVLRNTEAAGELYAGNGDRDGSPDCRTLGRA